jgi:hypothetical protein
MMLKTLLNKRVQEKTFGERKNRKKKKKKMRRNKTETTLMMEKATITNN